MAEFIMKDLLKKAGRSQDCLVASSATSTEEIPNGVGNPVYPPARAELLRHGIECERRQAVLLKPSDYEEYDLLIGMDRANLRNMHRILGGDPQGKLRLLMDYTDRGGEVADPWYSDRFDITYRDIEEGCRGLLATFIGLE